MFYVINAFFLTTIILFMKSFDRNGAALRSQRHAWTTRLITTWLMPMFALMAATGILIGMVELYERTGASYSRNADESFFHSSMILLLTVMIFKKVSVYDGLRDGLSSFFSFRRSIANR